MTPRYRPAGACGVYQDMSGKPFHTEGKAGGEFWGCGSNFCMATYKQTMADRLASEKLAADKRDPGEDLDFSPASIKKMIDKMAKRTFGVSEGALPLLS